jgi:GlpG protein
MQAPPLAHWQRYPVTVGIALGAVAMTAWTRFGEDLDRGINWMMTDQFWSGQLWRPLTSCLLHGNVLHLGFNLYWLWIFGAVIEGVFGSARMFCLMIFLAVGSSLAQYALSGPGIGLSGAVYGLFGLLWVLQRSDRRFFQAIDDSTVKLLIAWFFLCIILTFTKIMPVANVAHGSGAILGAMLGFAIVEKDKRRKFGYASLLVLSMLAIFALASVGREYVNFSGDAEREKVNRAIRIAQKGNRAYDDDKYAEAAKFYSQALAIDDAQAAFWFNLGLCHQQLGNREKARDAFSHAVKLDPDNQAFKRTLDRYSPSD